MTKFVAQLSTIAFAAVALATAAAPARADTVGSNETQSITVDFSDLNLSSDQGMDRLHARITHAAGQVCGYDNGTRDLANDAKVRSCMNRAIAGANTRVAAILRGGDQRVAMISNTSARINTGK